MSHPVVRPRSTRTGASLPVVLLAAIGVWPALAGSSPSGSVARAPEGVHFWPARIDLTGEGSDQGRVVDLDGDGRGEYVGGWSVVRVYSPSPEGWLRSAPSFELVGSEPPFHVVDHDRDGFLDVIAISTAMATSTWSSPSPVVPVTAGSRCTRGSRMAISYVSGSTRPRPSIRNGW